MKSDSARTSANQQFHRPVGGVSGRDWIDNSEHNSQTSLGDGAVNVNNVETLTVVQLNQLLASLAESTHQANFYAATGIRCVRPARLQLEQLMESHQFHYHELGRAWNTRAIVWDAKRSGIRTANRKLDLAVGWSGLAFSCLTFTWLMVEMLSINLTQKGPYTNTVATLLIFGFFGSCIYFGRSHLYPQQVAKRVEQALRGER